ncbi:sulfite exporter TauE/SafE family protein [Krasilnikovia cinnamomea]|uniref:sulfite exporter TauE/SafE family protein n=1 Tax=Krasilnikovia cinnamomea TaxID=349313 RepID=UPI001F5EF238|nr:sulfite exporter TauE/SafE family protein [Krasilnikovia cinnamomea]
MLLSQRWGHSFPLGVDAVLLGAEGLDAVGTGIAVGFLTGLFGVGGGFLIPALVLLLGLDMPAAVATSLVIIVINSFAGFAAHASDAAIDYRIAAAFTVTAIAGSLAAGRIATRIPTRRLQRLFAYLVFAVAAFVVIGTI